LEFSTKPIPERVIDTAVTAREFLLTQDVDLAGEQQTKTKTALEFFASAAQPATG
jgi:hypothetical protein